MAFWRVSANFTSLNAVSGVNKLLEKPDCSLAELLDEDDILQELREHNAKLIEFLRQRRILQQLLRYISHWTPRDSSAPRSQRSASSSSSSTSADETSDERVEEDNDKPGSGSSSPQSNPDAVVVDDGDDDDDDDDMDDGLGLTRIAASPEPDSSGIFDDEKAWRYARQSTEVFSSEIWSIYETVMKETKLLDEFWSFLDNPAPLDPVYAGYFAKTNEQFLERKTDQMVEFVKSQPNLVERFMRHIDTPAIMDLLLKILCTDKIENPTGVIECLQAQRLIPRLVSFLTSQTPSNTQSAAGEFLKALVTISANASNDFTSIGPNELTRELVSPAIVAQLAEQMVTSGGKALATAVAVIVEIIRKNNSDYDMVSMMTITLESHPPNPRDPIYLGYLLGILAENMPRFQHFLTKKRDIRLATSFGSIEPLGTERFKVCELVAELLHCSNMALLNDPRAADVARERDAVRQQHKAHWHAAAASEPRNSLDSDAGVSDLAASVHDLAVDDQADPQDQVDAQDPQAAQAAQESRGWWGLKKPGAGKDSVQSPPQVLEGADESGDVEPEPERELTQKAEPEDGDDVLATDPKNLVVGDFLKYQLIKYRVVSTIIEMFFKFPWNNFLHNVVFDILQQIFNGPIERSCNRFLAIELFKTDHITDQIVAGTKASNQHELATRMRLGYMGHLTLISEEVVKFLQRYPPETLSPAVVANTVDNESWNEYVNETLMQIRIRDNSILGGQRPSSELPAHHHLMLTMGGVEGDAVGDDDDDDGDVAAEYSNNASVDKDDDDDGDSARAAAGQSNDQWTRYMSQQMTPDRFGSSDEDDEDEEIEEIEDPEDEADDVTAPAELDDVVDDDDDRIGSELTRASSHEL